VVVAGDDLDVLESRTEHLADLARGLDGLVDVDTTVRIGKPELRVRPKRAVLADLGIPATAVGLSLRANVEGIEAGTFKRDGRNYDIVVLFVEEEGKQQVPAFLFPGAPGKTIPLVTIGEVEETVALIQITRKDKRRIAKVFANLAPGMALGTAVRELEHLFSESGGLPPGYDFHFAGSFEYMEEGQAALGEAGLIAVVLVVLTLAGIMESFRQPPIVLVTVPLALIGIVLALAWTASSVSIFVIMGGVMLIGVVVNNAILILDRYNALSKEGRPRGDAMALAARERLRPVLMITIAAILGMLPLALGQGIGAELRTGVGIASVGGILSSGVLTMLVLPALYSLLPHRPGREESTRA
jgi:HAE1 family hydrophobic/amphiphilic exporter-1